MSRPMRAHRVAVPILLAVAIGLAVSACGPGGAERKSRARGSAVWLDPRMGRLAPAEARILRSAGVEEVFVAAGELVEVPAAEGGGLSIEPWTDVLAGAAPARSPVTLGVVGLWPPSGMETGSPDPAAMARVLAPELISLRGSAEEADLLPVGVHFHLDARPTAADERSRIGLLAETIERIREELPHDLLLSVSVDRSWLHSDAIGELARASDFVVPFLYGDPPGAPDRPESWDPARVEEDLARLRELEADYLLGVRTVGSASRLGVSGEVQDVTTRASLSPLAESADLRRTIGDAFAGVGRLVYLFQAQRRTAVAAWEVAPGEGVRVVRTAPSLIHDLRLRAAGAGGDGFLGLLVHRLPGPGENLSVEVGGMAAVFGEAPPTPDLRADLVIESSGRQKVVLGVTLRNRSSLSTDLALGDGNYVSLRTEGAIVERVDPGGFSRYSLWRRGVEVRPGVDWREPDEVRLYTPMVAGGERIGGARVEMRPRPGVPQVHLGGRFYLPDGRELAIEPTEGALERLPSSE